MSKILGILQLLILPLIVSAFIIHNGIYWDVIDIVIVLISAVTGVYLLKSKDK